MELIFLTQEKADALRPILRWVKADAPDKRDRQLAAGLLEKIKGIRDFKQVVATRKEALMVHYIEGVFPRDFTPSKQLRLEGF